MASNQMQILQSLIEADNPEAIPILIDCLRSSHHATVRFAAESIGAMAKKQKDICNIAVSELVDALATENAQIRKSVLNTLLLLDIPLCYSSAISNVVRGDNQPYNKTLAKKIIQNIISNDSSFKYDNYSEPSSTFRQGAEVHKVDHDTESKTVEPHIRFDRGVIKNVSAVMPDVDAEFFDFRDYLKSDYPSKYSQMDSSEEPYLSREVTVLVDNKESVEVGFNEDHAEDCDEKDKLSSPDYEHSGLTSKPLEVHAADNQDCADISDGVAGVFDYEFSDKLVIDEHYNEIMRSYDPEEFIPATLYNQWRAALLASPSANQNLVALAEEINLHWATTRFDETVSDYLQYDLKSIRSIPTFGRKKTRTLILCVMHAAYKLDRVGFQNDCTISDNNELIKETLIFEELLACDRPVGKITEELWQTWCLTIGDTLAADMKIAEIAARYKLVWPYMKRHELVSKYLDFPLHKITHLYTFGNKKIRTLVLCIASLILDFVPSENSQVTEINKDEQPIQANIELCDITNLVQNELANLSDREQHVAKKRYGLDCESPCTLEEIAGVLGVTRERVRQIQIKVVERLKVSAMGALLPGMLSKLDADEIWARLSSSGVIYKADVNRAFEKQLKGEFMLALECCGMTVATWLSTIATEGALAWYRSSFSQYELAMLLLKVEVLIQQAGMPLPLPTISQHLGISENDAGMLICLSSKYKMFEGFTFEGSIGARARRTVHLHQLLNSETTFLSLQNLVVLHNYQFPKESCTTRDADIVMREAPHLFVMLGDKGWCSIGSYQADKSYRSDPSIIDNDAAQQTDPVEMADDSNVTSIITTILRNRGLSNFMDIVTEFQNIAGNTYSAHSVGPTLFTRDDFVKFAPSIYGLREHLKGFGVSTSDLLLNDHDCQLFIMARYAGEAFGSFRLWNPVMEYKWYQWLEKRSNEELRASFYFIATPEEWPVNNKSAQELKYKIKQQADTYHLLKEPKYIGSSLPDIRSIYALIRYAKDNGSINWISANLVLGRRIDDYHTAIDIAFLVCFGALEPAYNWQMLHKAKDDVTDIENKLSNMLHCGQGADWKSPVGEFLLDIFTININVNDMGWVDVSSLNSLFHNAPTLISSSNVQASQPTEKAFSLVGVTQVSSASLTFDLVKNEAETEKTETDRPLQSKVNLGAVIILDDLKPTIDYLSQEADILPKECENSIPDKYPTIPKQSADILLQALKTALNPEDLISDEMWSNWSQKLLGSSFASKLIHTVANQNNLPWPVTKEYECFDEYLGLPLNRISKTLAWKHNRTILLCVANAALKVDPERKGQPVRQEAIKPEVYSKNNSGIEFKDLIKSDNPFDLITSEMWDDWRTAVIKYDEKIRYISDMVDELGSLYWQARWKYEKLSEYYLFSLDDIREIKFPGKNRTIIICMAKIALDALAVLDSCVTNINNNGITNLSVSTPSANVVFAAPPKPVLNQVSVEQMTDVLSSHFANGFRLNSPIEMARFRSFFKRDVGEELTLPDEELKNNIVSCGTTFDGKVYAVSAQVKERIKRQAEDYFSDGAQAIFFAEFYAKNESWLFEASVVSEDMLIEVLRRLFPKLAFTQTYFGYTDASIVAALEGEILRVWGDDVLRTYGQLAERLRYIPLERIKNALGQNGDFIWNSVETFSHVSRIEVTDEERLVIREAALRECNSRGYASIADLPFGEIEERNYGLSFTAVHNAVYRICLSDKLDIKGKIITRKGDTLDALTIMKNYCLTIERCSLDDLLSYEKELTGEVHRWIPMEAGNTVLVRIDKDNYVADRFVHFDSEAVDAAIELFIEGDYLQLISFTTFGAFPHCGQAWNLFLLESYCRRFSRKFRFDTPSVNSRNAGAVIRNNCGMDYTEIMTDAVANADIPLKDTAVGQFLYESGFTGRRSTAKVNEIIDKAKAIRKRKD